MTPSERREAQRQLDEYLGVCQIRRDERRKEARRADRLGIATPAELALIRPPRRFPDRIEPKHDAPWTPAR